MASNTHSILRDTAGRRNPADAAERRAVTAISVYVGRGTGSSVAVRGRGIGLARAQGSRGHGMPTRHRPLPSSVYWRRRLVVLVVVVGAFLAGGKALEALGGGPLAAAEVRSSPSSAAVEHPAPPADRTSAVRLVTTPVRRATYVVQSGDTLWTIARSLQPEGDIRPLVDDLAATRHGRPLQPGERIELP